MYIQNKPQDFNPNDRKRYQFESPTSISNRLLAPFRVAPVAAISSPIVKGVDLSRWNYDPIDWAALWNAGYRFVIQKMSEGDSYVDHTFERRIQEAFDAGFIVAGYHFFRSNIAGTANAFHAWRTAQPLIRLTDGNTKIFNDVETSDGVSVSVRNNRLTNFWQFIKENFKEDGDGVYSSPYMWNYLTGGLPLPITTAPWDAHWADVEQPIVPNGWQRHLLKFWQIGVSNSGYYWVPDTPGIRGRVDVNYFLGTEDELKSYMGWDVIIDPPDEPCVPKVTILQDGLRVRTGPGTSYPVVGYLYNGEIVEISEIDGSDSWVKLSDGNYTNVKYGNDRNATLNT